MTAEKKMEVAKEEVLKRLGDNKEWVGTNALERGTIKRSSSRGFSQLTCIDRLHINT